jgi:hypothetical protein
VIVASEELFGQRQVLPESVDLVPAKSGTTTNPPDR